MTPRSMVWAEVVLAMVPFRIRPPRARQASPAMIRASPRMGSAPGKETDDGVEQGDADQYAADGAKALGLGGVRLGRVARLEERLRPEEEQEPDAGGDEDVDAVHGV